MKNLSLFLLAMALIFVSGKAGAFSSVPMATDTALATCGQASVVLAGKVTEANPTRLLNGWGGLEFTVVGQVLKGNDECPVAEGESTCKFKIINTIKGLHLPAVGSEGIHAFYGNGAYGSTSYCGNGAGNAIYEKAEDGSKFLRATKFQNLKNKTLQAKMMQKLPAVNKALGAQPTGTVTRTTGVGSTLSPQEVVEAYQFMLNEFYPAKK